MSNAPLPADPAYQTPKGVGARLLHGFGATLRRAIAGGSAVTARLRRPSPPCVSKSPAEHDEAASASASSRRASPQAAGTGSAGRTRPGWLARWWGARRRRAASRFPDGGDLFFTPEAYPGLSPEACAFFNTPVEECDPDELRVILAALAMLLVDHLPPEAGMDARAIFATLCGRLGATPGDAEPAGPPAGPPPAEPQAAPDIEPEESLSSPAPKAPPQPVRRGAAATAATGQSASAAASLSGPMLPAARRLSGNGRSLRYSSNYAAARRSAASPCNRQAAPLYQPRRTSYAARASPV